MARNDFCVFILSYKRAKTMKTLRSLQAANYTGKYYIVVGNDDPTIEEYKEIFGEENIIIFDKDEYMKKVECCDNFREKGVILYARNACFDIAKRLGYKYFLELDDDYGKFAYRYANENRQLKTKYIAEFDTICDLVINFLDESKALTVAFAQNGDFAGGANGGAMKGRLRRKAMNSFFCSVEHPFNFFGTFNEDVNTYALLGSRGELFFTVSSIAVDQAKTQQKGGGMTESYLKRGTYVKSSYTLINCPSFTTISFVGNSYNRIHHRIDWEKAVPKIISDKYRKE